MTIQLRCPSCNRFLAEVQGFARVVCSGCGAETTFKSREERRRPALTFPGEGGFTLPPDAVVVIKEGQLTTA